MKFSYHADTDSLYIDLADRPSVDSREVASDVVVDLDAEGRIVGIEIQHASEVVDLSRLDAESLPVRGASR
ncbi:MAG TPA: DUF2283 domain-containing protein [Gemmatimonadota bacterium]|nr:DUF2283 domain-containing protein [Gemmatimonadota bacterium]